MIKSSELRVGNLLEFYNYIESSKIVSVTPRTFCSAITEEDFDFSNYYRPIQITEEWLITLGFLKHKENGRFGYRYYISVADYIYIVEKDFNEYPSHFFGVEYTDSPDPKDDGVFYSFSFDLKYVHQLQNIYFSLTGKELKITKDGK